MEDFNQLQQPMIGRLPELIYGLRNIIQNASDFSNSLVNLNVKFDEKRIIFEIKDDGRGFPIQLLDKIGEPFLTEGVESKSFDIGRGHYKGMGLGLFIAKTLLEHLGATVSFKNYRAENASSMGIQKSIGSDVLVSGALVEVRFDRNDLEISAS